MNNLLDSPLFQEKKARWLPFISLAITLHGILLLHWDLKPVIFLFWWEVILIVLTAILRMLGALDNQPVADLIVLKLKLLIAGFIFGGMFIMFSVVFTFKAFEGDDYSGLANVGWQSRLMTITYLLGLVIHYFGNGSFRKANPGTELIRPFVQLLILMALLMALTMHLIPAYPQLEQARWVAVSVVLVKFVVDLLFAQIGKATS